MTKELVLNTLDDLVGYVLSTQGGYGRKYNLDINTRTKFVDEAAGKEWDKKFWALTFGDAQRSELRKVKPEEVTVTIYTLIEAGEHYSRHNIYLYEELGALVASVWPVKEDRYHCERRAPRTLEGLLKLMGKSDISKQVAAAKARAEDERKAMRRANTQEWVSKKAAELAKYIQDNDDDLDVKGLHIWDGIVSLLDENGNPMQEPIVERLPRPFERQGD